MTFLQRVDVVKANVLDTDLPSIFLESRHLIIRATLVMENQMPWQVFVFWRLWIAQAHKCVELDTDWHVPAQG